MTTTADVLASDGKCSLREAVQAANTDTAVTDCPAGSGADTVAVPAGTYTIAIGPDVLDTNATGDFNVTSGLTIAGAGAGKTIVDADRRDRVLEVVSSGITVSISGVTITGGRSADGLAGATGGSGTQGINGGGIRNAGTLTLTDCEVRDNATGSGGAGGSAVGETAGESATGGDGEGGGNGGGIFSSGTLTLTRTTVSDNSTGRGGDGGSGTAAQGSAGPASGAGGAGGVGTGGNGGAGGAGGGIVATGPLTVTESTIASNTTGPGGAGGVGSGGKGGTGGSNGAGGTGGSAQGGSGGYGGTGGGMSVGGPLVLTRSTIAANETGSGGPGGGGTGGAGGQFGTGGAAGGSAGTGLASYGGSGGEGGGADSTGAVSAVGNTFSANRTGAGANGGTGTGGAGANAGGNANGGAGGNGGGGFSGRGGDGGGTSSQDATGFSNTTWSGNAAAASGASGSGVGGKGGNGSGTGNGGNGGGGFAAAANSGGSGGAIAASGATSVLHGTIASNSVGSGGPGGAGNGGAGGLKGATGTAAGANGSGSPTSAGGPGVGGGIEITGNTTVLVNTVAAGNAGPTCDGSTADGGHNVISDASCGTTAADPKLGPLQDNGGPTRTRALKLGSPAIDTVPSSGAGCEATDQRGVSRPRGAACDAGAYELAPPDVTTAAATGVGQTTATLQGTLTPNSRASTYHFEFGKTIAYGSRTPDSDGGGGVTPRAALAGLTGLSPNTTYHFRVVVTSPEGETAGGDRLLKTLKPPDRTAPVFLSAKLSPTSFTVKKGTTFTYKLSEAAKVVFKIELLQKGKAPKLLGSFTQQSHAGTNTKRFSGKIGSKNLKPGSYRATLVATDAAHNASKPKRLGFKVVGP